MTTPLTTKELLELPPTIDLVTAGRAFGIGRTTAYALARSEAFPCKTVRAGKAIRAVTADLLRVLEIGPTKDGGAEPCPSDAA